MMMTISSSCSKPFVAHRYSNSSRSSFLLHCSAQPMAPAHATTTTSSSSSSRRSRLGAAIVVSASPRSPAPVADTASRASLVLPAALAAVLVSSAALLSPVADAAARDESGSFGAERTRALIESQGTPAAAKPDTMKTNVPFQAPGINAPPRGYSQERGTNVKRVLKDAGKQIKENYKDPDSAPLGISKGPLVREAKKMKQPGNIKNVNKAGAEAFKQQSPEPASVKAVKADSSKRDKGGYFILIDKLLGKR